MLNLPAHTKSIPEVGSLVELETLIRTSCPPSPNFHRGLKMQNLASIFELVTFDSLSLGNSSTYVQIKMCTEGADHCAM